MFIGQERLKKAFSDMVGLSTLPHFIILVGVRGQGKTLMAEYIAKTMDAPIYKPEDLKVNSIRTIIDESLKLSRNTVYLLQNADEMQQQSENAMLKLVEEPPKYAYVIMEVTDINNVLPTIKSRARVFKLDPYLKKHLCTVTTDPLMLKMAKNFGDMEELGVIQPARLYKYAEKVLLNVGKVSSINALYIAKELKFKDEEYGYPLHLFLEALICVGTDIIHNVDYDKVFRAQTVQAIKHISAYKRLFKSKGLNKSNLFDMFIWQLRAIYKGEY